MADDDDTPQTSDPDKALTEAWAVLRALEHECHQLRQGLASLGVVLSALGERADRLPLRCAALHVALWELSSGRGDRP